MGKKWRRLCRELFRYTVRPPESKEGVNPEFRTDGSDRNPVERPQNLQDGFDNDCSGSCGEPPFFK
jgi:hypothetical protein